MAFAIALALALSGCATTFVPISWDFGEKVQQLSRSDPTLAILFNRYDPLRNTLRVAGDSFDEVMMPSEVKYHLGAYRKDTKLIYRNLYKDYSDSDLRDLMVHEFAHHIWFGFMSSRQQEQRVEHLRLHPSLLQKMVRHVYHNPSEFDTEDFAFTVEYARAVDIRELARLNLISASECDTILAELATRHPMTLVGCAEAADTFPELSQAAQ